MRVHGLDLKKDKALEEAKSGVLRDDMVAKHVEEANFRREQDEFAAAFSRTGPFDTTQKYTPCRSEVKADAEEQASVDDAIAQSKADAECKSHIDAAAAEFGADPRTGTVPASAPPDKLVSSGYRRWLLVGVFTRWLPVEGAVSE